MKFLFCLLLIWSSNCVFAQSPVASLTIFSERGDKFFVYLNGQKINPTPLSKVKVEDLPYVYYAVKVEYDDASHYTISKEKLFVCNKKGELRDFTYELVREDSEMKLKFVSMKIPAEKSNSRENFIFSYSDKKLKSEPVIKKETQNIPPINEGVAVNNKKADTVIQTKTITSTDQKNTEEHIMVKKEPVTTKVMSEENSSDIVNALVLMEPKKWTCKSEWPMLKSDYENSIRDISNLNSDAEKLSFAKELASKNCLKAEQVMEIASLMNNESERLEFLKFSYPHTIDIKNYLKATKLFTEEKNKSAFLYFISH